MLIVFGSALALLIATMIVGGICEVKTSLYNLALTALTKQQLKSRETIEALEAKLAETEATLVKERQVHENAAAVFENTIRLLEVENAQLTARHHENTHASSKEERATQEKSSC